MRLFILLFASCLLLAAPAARAECSASLQGEWMRGNSSGCRGAPQLLLLAPAPCSLRALPPPPFAPLPPPLRPRRAGLVGTIACSGDSLEVETGVEWDVALAPLANASALNVTFADVAWTEASFNRMLSLVFGSWSGAGSAAVTLRNSTMKGLQADVAGVAEIAGSRQYAITILDSEFSGNRLNITGALAAEEGLDVSLRLLGSGEGGSGCLTSGRGMPGPCRAAAGAALLASRRRQPAVPTSCPPCPPCPPPFITPRRCEGQRRGCRGDGCRGVHRPGCFPAGRGQRGVRQRGACVG